MYDTKTTLKSSSLACQCILKTSFYIDCLKDFFPIYQLMNFEGSH